MTVPGEPLAPAGPPALDRPPARVAILADDLIWATRLSRAVADAGGLPALAHRAGDLARLVDDGVRLAIVDLTARAYDGVAAVAAATAGGARVLAVGQHDDVPLRKRALAAGAERVHPYRRLFDDGPAVLAAWLLTAP